MVGMFTGELGKIGSIAAVGQRAACIKVRNQNFLIGVKDLNGLTHEMHACQKDNVCIDANGLLSQSETVTNYIGNVLNVACLVIVSHKDGIFLLLKFGNLFNQIGTLRNWLIDVTQLLPFGIDVGHQLYRCCYGNMPCLSANTE